MDIENSIDYLNSLDDILTELILNRTCYLDFNNALIEQKAKQNNFISWCLSNYYKVTVINLCKLLEPRGSDNNKRTLRYFVNFWKKQKNYEVLKSSMENAVIEYHEPDTGKVYTEDISQDMLRYLASISLENDLIKIQSMHTKLKTLRDKKLVHNDYVDFDIDSPRIVELHNFIDEVEAMIKSYYRLFRQGITYENLKQSPRYGKFTLRLK